MREPPGCPPGPPPDIDDDGDVIDYSIRTTEDELEGEEDASSDTESKTVKPTSLQQKMVALSGQNVDDFIKEMETVQKKIENSREEENRAKLTAHIEPLVPPGKNSTLQFLNFFLKVSFRYNGYRSNPSFTSAINSTNCPASPFPTRHPTSSRSSTWSSSNASRSSAWFTPAITLADASNSTKDDSNPGTSTSQPNRATSSTECAVSCAAINQQIRIYKTRRYDIGKTTNQKFECGCYAIRTVCAES